MKRSEPTTPMRLLDTTKPIWALEEHVRSYYRMTLS